MTPQTGQVWQAEQAWVVPFVELTRDVDVPYRTHLLEVGEKIIIHTVTDELVVFYNLQGFLLVCWLDDFSKYYRLVPE